MSFITQKISHDDIDHLLVSHFRYAGFGVRLLASLIDLFLYLVILLPIGLLFDSTTYADSTSYSQTELILQFAAAVVYIFCWMYFAATPGKVLMGLKVLDAETGKNITFSQGVIRYLGYFVSALVFCLGYFWIFFDSKKQAWHDKMAKTVVVQEID
ncbi:RDD family protein [Acinetobacter rudis]|uniref:RDD family protein n=1 Tax=Acinetobacter rudis TaxID=632955 RepID=A0AAW8JCA1_9GAMM|nr:RDD family protein [Acinetobacter rudis]MDQ8936731.1 RDD family protein [Acinetobacter rudis]MDQ8952251.1 RDD family protein [Acinetobacter rudis]MDQ9018952.1 RDD family protein [Acinetobacter rudis]